MSLESGSYISDLIATNPEAGDGLSQADDHMRLIKALLLATFPNINGAVTATPAEINYLSGATSALQTQIDAVIPSGTQMVFTQAAAPTGWTQVITYNGYGLRVVSGTGGGVGGSSDAFADHTHTVGAHSHGDTFAVSAHTLTTAEMPSHTHRIKSTGNTTGDGSTSLTDLGTTTSFSSASGFLEATGSGGSHTHGLAGEVSNSSSFDSGSFSPYYVNTIICSKD